jgi:formamidopyrimidine-DNA glycosylase
MVVPTFASMTEGHAAHGIALRLGGMVGSRARSSSPAGLFGADHFDRATMREAEAVGKHLLVSFYETPGIVHVHLAMRGRWSIRSHHRALDGVFPRTEPPIKGRVGWRLMTATHHAELTDPSVCEVLDTEGLHQLRSRLGPDPLRVDADPETAVVRMHRSSRAIGDLILDQAVLAGVGNVYRAELLYRAGLSPFTPGTEIPVDRLFALWDDTVRLMRVGLAAGWIITDAQQLEWARDRLVRGQRVPRWRKTYAVYRREHQPCRACGTSVLAQRLGLQRVFWCPGCQPDITE